MALRPCILPAILLMCLTGAPSLAQNAADTKPARLTPEQLIATHHVSDPQFSPDGKHLAFVVSEPPKGEGRKRHIWMLDVATHALRQFTNSEKNESSPRWSPDGKQLAFLSNRGERPQIYLIATDGGEASALTEEKSGIAAFEWSPDGKQIAFLAEDAKTDAEEKKEKDKDDARLVDKEDKRSHLWLFDIARKKSRLLVGAPWSFDSVKWLPGSASLIAVATDHPEVELDTSRIFLVPTDGASSKDSPAKMTELAAPKGPFGDVQVSPDGKCIAWLGSRVDGPQPGDIFVMDGFSDPTHAPLPPRNLTASVNDRTIVGVTMAPACEVQAWAESGFRSSVLRVPARARMAPTEMPLEFAGSIVDSERSSDGVYALVGGNATQPDELYLWNPATEKSAPVKVTSFNEAIAKLPLSAMTTVKYKSFDGREIEAGLILPPGTAAKSASPLPAVLLIHGGPTGRWQDSYFDWAQALASAGYAVFMPNVRGSTGYGYDFMVSNRADWGGADFKDVMAAADYLVSGGIADPKRIGIAGWSYGGFMSEWAITQTTRFRAAVSGAGMFDLATEFGTEDHPSYDEWFWGLPWEKPEGFRKFSPQTYVKNARTPTLIMQGDADTIDPLGQSTALYRALKRYGVDTELVIYPREPHGLREEKHLTDRLRRVVEWFDRHMKDQAGK